MRVLASWRKSPCPEVWEIMAPEGKMRGPVTRPRSMAIFRPKAGPPTSRTAVKPRISARTRLASSHQMQEVHVGAHSRHLTDARQGTVPVSIDQAGDNRMPPQSITRTFSGRCPSKGSAIMRSPSIRILTSSRIVRVSPSNRHSRVSSRPARYLGVKLSRGDAEARKHTQPLRGPVGGSGQPR